MLATLPMYDWPEENSKTDAKWAAMAKALGDAGLNAPETLDRSVGYEESWTRDDLVLGEACGLPFIRELKDRVEFIGAMKLDLPDCPPGHYYSHIIVAASSDLELAELDSQIYAFNTKGSQSGLACLKSMGMARGEGLRTGSHRNSIRAVAAGEALYAAIDANSWNIAMRHETACKHVRIIGQTPTTPCPVYIAAKGVDVQAYRRALSEFIVALDLDEYEYLL